MMHAISKIFIPFIRVGLLKGLFLCCLLPQPAIAQQQVNSLIQADSSWDKEVFPFPLSFAPEIAYPCFEEAWFPKAWAHKDSAAFWSYAFGWRIETKHPLTVTDLEQNLKEYFDGLMGGKEGLPKDKLPGTVALFLQNASEGNRSYFKGKIQIFDAFTLKAPLMLHVTVEQYYCKEHLKSMLLFRFSPKTREHPIWKQLNELSFRKEILEEDKCL